MANRQYIYIKATAPTVNDDTLDGYIIDDRWVDTTNDRTYQLIDSTAGAAIWVPAWIVSGVLDGLKLTWNSATSVTIGKGYCYAENGDRIDVTGAITKSSLSLSATTWYHIYVYLSSSVAAAEVVTTAPVAWQGSAYSKTGDTSRRYVGSIKADGSSNVYDFKHIGDYILYNQAITASPFRVLSAGTATANTTIACSAVVPVTATGIKIYATNLHASVVLRIANSAGTNVLGVRPASGAMIDFFTDASQNIYYSNSAGSGDSYLDVFGYILER